MLSFKNEKRYQRLVFSNGKPRSFSIRMAYFEVAQLLSVAYITPVS